MPRSSQHFHSEDNNSEPDLVLYEEIIGFQGDSRVENSSYQNEIYSIVTTLNEVYGVSTDVIETTPNEVYGVSADVIETTPNEVYGISTDSIETTPNEVYGINTI